MKRLLILAIIIMPFLAFAQSNPVDRLFEKYANKEGFTTVRISGALLGFASKFADANDPESNVLAGLKGVRILSVDDQKLNAGINFYKELEKDGFFKNHDYEVLMEVTESNEVVRFFGRNAGGGKLSELLLIVGGDDNALISIQGVIDPESIGKITGALDIDVMPKKEKK